VLHYRLLRNTAILLNIILRRFLYDRTNPSISIFFAMHKGYLDHAYYFWFFTNKNAEEMLFRIATFNKLTLCRKKRFATSDDQLLNV